MSDVAYFVFLVFRNFIPMSPFMVPYLIENKHFTKKEVMNNITHCVFVFSIMTAIAAIFITDILGRKAVCIIDAAIELLVCIIMVFMRKRSFILGKIAGSLHGVTKSLETVSKSIMYMGGGDGSAKYSNYVLFKHTSMVIAGVCGQELYLMTQSHKFSIVVSMCSLALSVLCGLQLPSVSSAKNAATWANVRDAFNLRKNAREFTFCLLNITSSIFLIATSCYSTYIFIERGAGINIVSNRFGRALHVIFTPIRFALLGFVKMASFFDRSITINRKYDKNIIVFGYLDALAKISFLLPRYLITRRQFTDERAATIVFVFLVITLVLMYLLYRGRSAMTSYALTIMCLVTSMLCLGVSHNGFYKCKEHLHVFYCVNLFISAIIHTSISSFSKKVKASGEQRMLYYCYVNILLMALAAVMCFLYIFDFSKLGLS